jgi:hypothetical protein
MRDIVDVAEELKRARQSCDNFQGPLEPWVTDQDVRRIVEYESAAFERKRTLEWVLGEIERLPLISDEYEEAVKNSPRGVQ